jgi:hypothetical protein
MKSLNLGQACGTDSIPNECVRHLSSRPVYVGHIYLITVFGSAFPEVLEGSKKS